MCALEARVDGKFEFGLDDDAQRAETADGPKKNLSVFSGAHLDDFAADEHHLDAPNRKHQRPEADVAAMHIDAE